MARADYIERVKSIVYGYEQGEQPSIRIAAADSAESISAPLVSFSVAYREGEKIKPGHTLSAVDDADPTNCFAIYVTGVADDIVTGVNGYRGSPLVTADDLDGVLFEQNPLVIDYKIHKAVDTIFAVALWPKVFDISTQSIASPNLATYQAELLAVTMEITEAVQVVAGKREPIPFKLHRNQHTTVSSTTVLADLDYANGSACYITAKEKFVVTDESEADNGLVEMVATGSAALLMGATVSEGQLAKSSKDSQDREDVGSRLWSDFLTLRESYSEGLAREVGLEFLIDRG